MSPDQPARDEIRQITSELTKLARTGKVLPGSIQQRHTRCGHTGCACQADPPRPHGPYWQWTRKVAGKTITRRLTPEQIEHYRPWIDNDRRIRELVGRLEALGIANLEATHPTH
jgi:hypothetical protein